MRLRIHFARDGHVDISLAARIRFFAERLAPRVRAMGIGPLSLFIVMPERHPWPAEMCGPDFN